jgi:hypothetical protein
MGHGGEKHVHEPAIRGQRENFAVSVELDEAFGNEKKDIYGEDGKGVLPGAAAGL